MKVVAVVLAVGLGVFAGCGGGESSEAQIGSEANRQASQSDTSTEAQTAHHAHQLPSQKQHQKESTAQKPQEGVSTAPSAVSPITAEEFEQFSGSDLGNWEIAYGVCAVTPEEQLAKEFHTEQNWAAIGRAYGEGYREPFNIAAEEGCMAALNDSSAEREAAFELMEG